jgi:hypothetical protein
MRKRLELDDRFYSTGEPTVLLVARSDRGRWHTEKAAHFRQQGVSVKLASPAFEFIKNITPRPGKTIVLVNALGAYEAYGSNRNGDGFPIQAYKPGQPAKCGHPACQPNKLAGWIAPEETLINHYQTFEQVGRAYRHHRNKRPEDSIGRVEKAFWNDRMKRVELLVELNNDQAKDLIEKIENLENVACSMGCHVRLDRCTICGHAAPTRNHYCEHVRVEMNRIDPRSGEIACVLNPSPRFFDISFVFRPADRTGWMLKKVAEHETLEPSAIAGAREEALEEKRARVRKLSDIRKELAGGPVTNANPEPDMALVRKYRDTVLPHVLAAARPADSATLDALASVPLKTALATLAWGGAALTTGELSALLLKKAGAQFKAAHVRWAVAAEPAARALLEREPDLLDKLADTFAFQGAAMDPELAGKIAGWMQKRAGLLDWARWRAHETGLPAVGRGAWWGPGAAYEAHAPGRTDVLTMTDPNTGDVYRTTRGAAMAADDANMRSLLSGTALLSAAYAAGGHFLPHVNRLSVGQRLLGAVPLAYGTMKALRHIVPPYEGDYQTDQGIRLPGNVEFRKSGSAHSPALLIKVALDIAELRSAVAQDASLARLVQSAEKVASLIAATFAVDEDASADAAVAGLANNLL